MRAVVFDEPGDEDVLGVAEVPEPRAGAGELCIEVCAAGVNRADLLQRQGSYPPPPGASPILGLECAGRVRSVGSGVRGWSEGDAVMALLPGGGYAEVVAVDAGCAMPVPPEWSEAEAGGFPEVFLTVFLNLFRLGGLEPSQRCLVHGGSSGIGTAAIALARAAGCPIAVTAGTDEKCARCRELGADLAVNYRERDFAAEVLDWSGGGVDVVLDSIGAPYFDPNVACLSVGGRLALIGLMGGAEGPVNLGPLLYKRITVIGSTLRARPVEEKRAIVSGFLERFGSRLASLRPLIHEVVPFSEAARAHRTLQASRHVGKVVLVPDA